MILLKLTALLLFFYSFKLSVGQLASMFGNAVQAGNCAEWGDWGPCIWLKGPSEDRNSLWHRPYFDQLLPGRNGCRSHIFFRLIRERWGKALTNVVEYLRQVIQTREPCGFCSFQQSCGRKCTRRIPQNGDGDSTSSMNGLFVAERLCPQGDQSNSCEFVATPQGDCAFWPNPSIIMPNVSEATLNMLNNIQFLNCIPQTIPRNSSVAAADGGICRCCCAPFSPNPEANYRCEKLSGNLSK